MAKIVKEDGEWERLFVNKEDIEALRRVISLAVISKDDPYDDALAIKQVAALIETAEVAHQQTMAAIQRAIDEQQRNKDK